MPRKRKMTKLIEQRAHEIYPSAKKMRLRTRLYALRWRAYDRIAMRKKTPPVVASSYKEFFTKFAERARAAKAARGERPVVVMVGGIAGAGKTTLSNRLKFVTENLYPDKKPRVVVISLDSYFKPRHKYKVKKGGREIEVSKIGVREVKPGVFRGGKVIDGEFDNPKASDLKRATAEIRALKDGKKIRTMQRDVSTGKIREVEIDGSKIDFLIVEGLYTLHAPLAKLGDVNIGVQASLGQQFLVRSTRDIQKRKREPTPTARKFAERAPYQKAFVIPTLKNADLIIDVEKARVSPGTREFMVWLGKPRREPEEAVFLNEIGLDHMRNRWRKIVREGKLEVVKGENDYERLSKVERIAKSNDPNAARILSNTLLVDPWWKVRSQCAESLANIKRRLKPAELSKIRRSLEKGLLEDMDWRVRAQCAETMAYIFGKEAVPSLAKALRKKGMHRLGILNALRDIGVYNPLAKRQKKLEPYIKGKIPSIQKLTEEAWRYFSEHPEVEMPKRYRKIFEDAGYIDVL